VILRSYLDDSGMNQVPISVLAGWIAPAASWTAFTDEWRQALEMKPRLQYFKMSECMGFGGQFSGWSRESRDLRLRYLVRLIEAHKLLGIGSVIPTADYRELFQNSPRRAFDVPYFLMFFGLMAGVATSFADIQNAVSVKADRVDFFFYDQPDQMDKVISAWAHFKEAAPESARPLLGDPPRFRSDETTLPLQAADLYAWHLRSQYAADFKGEIYESPWGSSGDAINTVSFFWKKRDLEGVREALDNAIRLGRPVEIWPK
jgi:hypothetical protein